MLKKVWIVEQGSYSDYSVVGIFSSEENANAAAKMINETDRYDEATVSERPLDPGVKELRQGLRMFDVYMKPNGDVESVEKCSELIADVRIFDRVNGQIIFAYVWAKDEAHAVKIVGERRTQLLASEELKSC